MKYWRLLLVFTLTVLIVNISPTDSWAAKKKKKKSGGAIPVEAGDTYKVKVKYKVKNSKKTKSKNVDCYKGKSGVVSKGKFVSYAVKQKKASGAKQELFKALSKAGAKGCKLSNSPSSPASPKYPEYLSLKAYDGPFGMAEAQRLYDVFGFGSTLEQRAQAVSIGLDKTVAQLTTYVPEPEIEAVAKDLECDGKIAGKDKDNTNCSPSNPNDLTIEGTRYAELYRFIYSKNQFFERLFFFLSDERMAISASVLSSCDRYALLDYISDLRQTTISGNYRFYMERMNENRLMQVWLDGYSNSGFNPNENYGREFWELGTVGPTGLDGKKVYSDIDIANSALAFSGLTSGYKEINGYGVCYGGFASYLHASGPKVVFAGTPYQAVVYDANDMVEATFANPRVAEDIAEDIWAEFINPYATASDIIELAKIIRENNYNLIPVFQRIMKSKAFYAAQSRKSLIKHPVEFVVGFLRATKIPISISKVSNIVGNDLLQKIFGAPTVFGWDPKDLAAEARILGGRNAILDITKESSDNLEKEGYDLHAALLGGLPVSGKSDSEATIERMAQLLGVDLNATQVATLKTYMDFNLYPCSWNQSKCKNGAGYQGGNEYYIVNEPYSVNELFEDWEYKLRGLLTILGQLPQYRSK